MPFLYGDTRDLASIPGLERSSGERKGYPLQYSGQRIPLTVQSMGSQRVGSSHGSGWAGGGERVTIKRDLYKGPPSPVGAAVPVYPSPLSKLHRRLDSL